jgi:hypothetical protein
MRKTITPSPGSADVPSAVANALPKVKESADIVPQNAHGAGVMELLAQIDSRDRPAEKNRMAIW